MGERALRIAAYGYFGMGNVGNEASLAAFLAFLRESRPDASVRCFGVDTETVRREHGVPARRLMAYRSRPGRRGLLGRVAKAVGRLWDVPRTFWMMRDVDVLVVPGTGVLETRLVTQPWGLPYWLFLATASCRLRGRRVALLSVGAEQADHPATRWFHRATVRMATWCSYRDEASREAMRSMGVVGRPGQVFPDLAFSLPAPSGVERPGHVVIGVMAWQGPPDDPERGPGVTQTYVERISELVTRLVDEGRTVTLVIGDLADFALAEEIEGRVRSVRPAVADGLAVSGADTLESLMAEMVTAQVVVASRFHNVIAALKACRPTVSLAYAGKNARLLAEFGLSGFDQPMESFHLERVVEQIAAVRDAGSRAAMEEALRRYDDALRDQFRRFSAEVLGPAAAARPEPVDAATAGRPPAADRMPESGPAPGPERAGTGT